MPIEPKTLMDAKDGVQDDIVDGLAAYLSPDPDVPLADAFTIDLTGSHLEEVDCVVTSETFVVIPWAYKCEHSGPFLEVPPTYVRFELRGATFVDVRDPDPDCWIYYRFIDFLCALHHIGVQTTVRPALNPADYLAWVEARPH